MAGEHDEDLDELEPKGTETEGAEDHEEEEGEATAKVDSELDEAADETEREEIRARRKAERKSRGQRHREKLEAMERNVAQLMARNAALEQQVGTIQNANTGTQLAQLDAEIEAANRAAAHFKTIIAQATTRQDGNAVAEATEYMIASRQKAQQLTAYKNNATAAMNRPSPANPAMVNKAQQFLGRNTWYGGPTSADPDSKVMTALDNSLTAEGWDSTTDAYWVELENRAKKYLPHRIAGAALAKRTPNPVPGGSQSSGGGEGATSFKLSPDRVAAIKSAGMWDDIKARNAMIKSYREYDKSQRS